MHTTEVWQAIIFLYQS